MSEGAKIIVFVLAANAGALALMLLIMMFASALPVRIRYSAESPRTARNSLRLASLFPISLIIIAAVLFYILLSGA